MEAEKTGKARYSVEIASCAGDGIFCYSESKDNGSVYGGVRMPMDDGVFISGEKIPEICGKCMTGSCPAMKKGLIRKVVD